MRSDFSLMALLVLCIPKLLLGQPAPVPKPPSVDLSKKPDSAIKSPVENIPKPQEPPELDSAFSQFLKEEPQTRLQEPITYLDPSGTSWVICPASPVEATRVRWKGAPARSIPPPAPGLGMSFGTSYGQGALWSLVAFIDKQALLLFRFDLDLPGDGWIKVGTFDNDSLGDGGGIPSWLVPLNKGNRFLGFSAHGLLEPGTERASFVGIYHNKEGKFSLESCIELPFDDLSNITKGRWFNVSVPKDGSVPPPGQEGKPQRMWMGRADPRILTPTLSQPSLSNDFLVLGAASAGVLWILDLESGRVRRTINLTGLGRKDLSSISPLKGVILGTAFAPDGSLIVASRPPDLIKFTVALDLDKPDSPEKDLRKKDFEALRNEIKDIYWLRIDPNNGSQERLDSPVDFPEQMPAASRQNVFRFLVNSRGYVKTNAFMPWPKVLEEFLTSFPDKPEVPVTPDVGPKDNRKGSPKVAFPAH